MTETETLWAPAPLPHTRGPAWHWQVSSVAQLPRTRADLRERAGETGGLPPQAEALEQMVLAFDELLSNGLRHGDLPVEADITNGSRGWLIDIKDTARHRPPTPALNRDPAFGGLGLLMVARLALAHGWFTDTRCKHVWAYLPSRTRS